MSVTKNQQQQEQHQQQQAVRPIQIYCASCTRKIELVRESFKGVLEVPCVTTMGGRPRTLTLTIDALLPYVGECER